MKNVSCFKLNIDRSKAPKKMGTLKDISLFGNFIFPTDGEYAGGLITQSLAGLGSSYIVGGTKAFFKMLSYQTQLYIYFSSDGNILWNSMFLFHAETNAFSHRVTSYNRKSYRETSLDMSGENRK